MRSVRAESDGCQGVHQAGDDHNNDEDDDDDVHHAGHTTLQLQVCCTPDLLLLLQKWSIGLLLLPELGVSVTRISVTVTESRHSPQTWAVS